MTAEYEKVEVEGQQASGSLASRFEMQSPEKEKEKVEERCPTF
jgi:hypothetical protein